MPTVTGERICQYSMSVREFRKKRVVPREIKVFRLLNEILRGEGLFL